ncbi:glycoside hydrolase family 12 protein [Sistotremastrum suecicum HHB10207 ss-3]|uniref:Glycoside hydrolase family 12 protein n=1 Tax=Sistotremastrum suecicum HHB10207 ss-3 TaxID=1314776 RepID=A0A166BJJ4_9AGAM|nr:glycoside hydrolase family 12 protein [Sistotremastrum suecicum HHB10207 ss-3]
MLFSLATLFLAPFLVSGTPVLEERATTYPLICGQWDTTTAGNYELFADLWGSSGATGGQCSQITALSGNSIAWKTNWTWSGGSGGVKSFSNIQQNLNIGKQLKSIQSIQAFWKWSQSSTGTIVADIAFDLFTANSVGGANVNEIMIWLANYNAGPISSQYNSNGTPKPVASNITLAGNVWNLYSGSNGANNVFSFLPAKTGQTITTFSGDINTFFQYLIAHEGVSNTQYLVTAQAGTEPTSGSAILTTANYSLAINV